MAWYLCVALSTPLFCAMDKWAGRWRRTDSASPTRPRHPPTLLGGRAGYSSHAITLLPGTVLRRHVAEAGRTRAGRTRHDTHAHRFGGPGGETRYAQDMERARQAT